MEENVLIENVLSVEAANKIYACDKVYATYMDYMHDQPRREYTPENRPPTLKEVWQDYNAIKIAHQKALAHNEEIDKKGVAVAAEGRHFAIAIGRCKQDKDQLLNLLGNTDSILDAPDNVKKLTEINALIETLSFQKEAKSNEYVNLQKGLIDYSEIKGFTDALIIKERAFLRGVIDDLRDRMLVSTEVKWIYALYSKTTRTNRPELIFKDFFFDAPMPLSKEDALIVIDDIHKKYAAEFGGGE